MTALELLSNLRSKDIEIWADGDQLGYKAPKGALTPDLRKELAARKSEILALLRQTDTVTSSAFFPLRPVSRAGDLPLSFAQERLWFLHHLEPDSVAYSLPDSLRLKGMLNKNALEKTFFEMARRHETLRTTFHSTDGNPVQRIAAEPNIVFDTVDLRHLPDMERKAEARRLSAEDARKPFDLRRGPLFRIRLFQLEDEAHVLYFNRHHIIYDYWSVGVMMREIATLYSAFIKDKQADLPELPVQYADYAVWQRQWLQGEALEAQLTYWKDKLGGELPVLELPTDRPRPAIQTHRGAIESFFLSKELTEALQLMSQQEGVTLFMTLLAAFKTLLYRLTGQTDTIVGTPIAGRSRTELEGLIGFFLNTMVMRTDLSGQPTFRELLGRVRETALGAYAHQDMPFERLVEELAPERDLSRTPLFQVFFNHMVARGGKAAELPGIKTEDVGELDQESQFDMTLRVLEVEGGLAARFEYSTDLFDAERIERMVRHFKTLLEGIVADPEKCICDLPILEEAERRQLLVAWNDTVVEYPRDKCIHELFEDQVNQTPDAIAVADKNEQITYQELNTRANQLAHYLIELGVGPQEIVGLCTKRSVEMVIGIMGILKAGGIYLPLDPSYPESRLSFMIEDSHALILLSDETSRSVLPKGKTRIVYIDLNDEIFTRHIPDNPVSCVNTETPAYLIYTSGSTGRPKGVIGLQRGLLNRFNWMWKTYPFAAGEICCQKTSISFVDSIWEILGPLLQGIRTVIISDEVVKDPRLFVKHLADEQITRIIAVPSYLRVILDADPDLQARLPKLKFWISSGEILSKELYQRFCEKLPQSLLLNLYGSSEVSADVTCYDTNSMSLTRQSVPIGRPIANTQLYILDPYLQPVPIGIPGELYIGGDNLAAGYLNLGKTTEKSFIPNPFSDKPDSRLFKTGDNGRWLADGNIEFIGRVDHQVKIRGFRIELGEVETVLNQHPKVRETVVNAPENRPDEKNLVAYFVSSRKQTPTIAELRRYLRQKLPDYMVPSAFVQLDSLPLLPNGKVDHRALPAPDNVRQESAETFVAPRDKLELQLTKIWEKVLGIKNVGIKDNFFDLGGHSLLALRLFDLIQKRFSKDLPLAILFQAPTVEQLAEILCEEIQPTTWTSLVPMQTEGSNPPFFCVPEAGSTIYSLSNLGRHLDGKQPFYGLQPLGMDGEHSPHTRIEDMAAHYIEEIKSVQPQGPYLLGGRCYGSLVAFEMAQQLCAQGEEVALLAILGDNFIPAWARKGVKSSKSAFSLVHSFQRTIYYLRHSSLGDVFRTAMSEVNIRVNPYLRGTRRILKAQLLARANYIRKPYPGRVTLFAPRSSSRPTYPKWTLAGLAEGGVDLQIVPRVYDRLLDEPHVQVVAAKLIACINKALDERFTTKPYTRQAVVAQARKKNGDSTRQVSGTENSPMSTYADARPTDSGTRLNLSLVLPCYNEGPHFSDKIEEIVQALDAAELEYEIILIDDRSTDETAQQIRSYLSGQHKRNIRAYYHDTNLGRGATVAEGIRLANGTYVGFIDIDLEIPPQFIPAALDALVSDSADMVLGNRKRNGAQESPLRLVMSSVYRWLVSQLLKTDSLDTEAGFKFFRRDLILPVLDEVQDSHWFWDTEITVVAQAKGLRIHSLPVTYCRDLTKQSTVRPFQDSWRSFAALLAFAKRHRFARHAVTRKQTP